MLLYSNGAIYGKKSNQVNDFGAIVSVIIYLTHGTCWQDYVEIFKGLAILLPFIIVVTKVIVYN